MSEKQVSGNLNTAAATYFIKPSDESLQDIVFASEGYVKYFCRLYGGSAVKDDLFQVGIEGLLKAVKEYNPSHGASFSTFAGYKIMGEIRHWVRKEISYRRPGSISSLQGRIDHFIESWYNENGLMPTPEQVAKALGIRVEGVVQVMRAGLVSYDDIDVEMIHSSEYRSFELPIEDKLLIDQLYQNLSGLHKKIWKLLFERKLTQEKAAKELGMTQRQISREKAKMILLIRGELLETYI